MNWIDGVEIDSVGVRIKGLTSVLGMYPPFKLDFNEYVSGQKFDGLKKLNLNNSFTDGTKQRDRLAYQLYRDAGIPAPRTAYAEVYINDEFIYVYLLVSTLLDKNIYSLLSLCHGTQTETH